MQRTNGVSLDGWLTAGEQVHATAESTDSVVFMTDRRILVITGKRAALDVPISGLRRIQFDVEKHRPATMVMVPEDPTLEAQVLTIAHEDLAPTAALIAQLGMRLRD